MSARSKLVSVSTLAGVALGLMVASASSALAACSDPPGPKVNYSDCDLRGKDFMFADLTNANLTGANLSGMDLSQMDFSSAQLDGANFSGANLEGANLCVEYQNVNFCNARMGWASVLREDVSMDVGSIERWCEELPSDARGRC